MEFVFICTQHINRKFKEIPRDVVHGITQVGYGVPHDLTDVEYPVKVRQN